MTKTRIYVVFDGETERLIRASTRMQAINYVVKGKYVARPATQDDIVSMMTDGIVVEDSKEIS